MKNFKFLALIVLVSLSLKNFAQNTVPPSGPVGIGTTTPSALLDVNGNAIIDSSLTVSDSLEVGNKLKVQQDMRVVGESVFVGDGKFKNDLKVLGITKMMGDAKVFGDLKIKSLEDTSQTAPRYLTINPNGRVGIGLPPGGPIDPDPSGCFIAHPWAYADGTDSDDDIVLCPTYKSVTIGGDLTVNGLTKLSTTGIGVTPDSQNQLKLVALNKSAALRLITAGSTQYGIVNEVTNPSTIAYSVTDATSQDKFVVMGDGSVGVGTNNLLAKLTVNAGSATGLVVETNHTVDYGYGIQSKVAKDLTKAITVYNTNSSAETFKVNGNGEVYATKIVVQATPFPDYVFEKDYNLMPLAELEKYIKTNKHLPSMPTAKMVKANGVDLGEINRVLVEKVEELTLYILEQEKRIIQLEKRYNKNFKN